MAPRIPEIESVPWKKLLALVLLVAVSASIYVSVGVKMYEADNLCRTEKVKCHGVELNGECKGYRTSSTEFVEKDSCSQLGNITQECNRIGKKICSINERSLGTSWSSRAEVEGLKCSKWDREYSLNLTSC